MDAERDDIIVNLPSLCVQGILGTERVFLSQVTPSVARISCFSSDVTLSSSPLGELRSEPRGYSPICPDW